jgi:hypothetical protein
MVFIPGGALVAGTSPDTLPRIADEEMPGEQVILRDFYIDIYPYPNEEGAIPLTNVTQPDASGMCAEQGKRLCSELEWEKACKGPQNTVYEYGNRYRAERCGTGAQPALRPSGFRVGCSSEYGVSDMHGGVWEWTRSPWGRGSERPLVAVRGGNALAGELVGRCANAMGRPPNAKAGSVGFRCCAGPPNDAEVVLSIERVTKLKHRDVLDKALAAKAEAMLPPEAEKELGRHGSFKIDRMWDWWPIGNERLVLFGGCAGAHGGGSCGLVITRVTLGRINVLGFAGSGIWPPAVQSDGDHRDVWAFGADELGSFKRSLAYVWGRVRVGDKERALPKRKSKKSDKKSKERRQPPR